MAISEFVVRMMAAIGLIARRSRSSGASVIRCQQIDLVQHNQIGEGNLFTGNGDRRSDVGNWQRRPAVTTDSSSTRVNKSVSARNVCNTGAGSASS